MVNTIPGTQEHACATMAVVEYLGLLVHLQSYTMAAEVAYYAIAMLFGMLLDGVADVSGKAIGFGCCCAYLQGTLWSRGPAAPFRVWSRRR